MKKTLFAFLLIFTKLILLAMGAVAAFVIWMLLSPEAAKNRLEDLLSQLLKQQFVIESLQTDWQNNRVLEVRLEHLTIRQNEHDAVRMTIDKIHLKADLSTLFKGYITLDKFQVLHPSISLTPRFFTNPSSVVPLTKIEPSSSAFDWVGLLDHIHVIWDQFKISDGAVAITFPQQWQIAPLDLSQIHWQGRVVEDDFFQDLSAEIKSKGQTGQLSLALTRFGLSEKWEGDLSLQQLPLHGLVVPGIKPAFLAMDVAGFLDLKGRLQYFSTQIWNFNSTWQILQGALESFQFQTGRLPLTKLGGDLTLFKGENQVPLLKVTIPEGISPLGKVAANLQIQFLEDKPYHLSLQVNSKQWQVDQLKGYLQGFLPDLVDNWINENLFDGVLRDIRLQLDLDFTAKFHKLSDILSLELTTQFEGVTAFPYGDLPALRSLEGILKLDLEWLVADVMRGKLPGGEIKQGEIRLGYGIPVITPLQIRSKQTLGMQQNWPSVRNMFNQSVPWLNQLDFSGDAKMDFSLTTNDLAGKEPFLMKIILFPQQGLMEFSSPNLNPVKIHDLTGELEVTLDKLVFQNIRFEQGPMDGVLNGNFAFANPETSTIDLQLKGLEALLPKFAAARLQSWLPTHLQSTLAIRPKMNEQQKLSWNFMLDAQDEKQQHFFVDTQWLDDSFSILRLEGQLGRISALGVRENPSSTKNDPIKTTQAIKEVQVKVDQDGVEALRVDVNRLSSPPTLQIRMNRLDLEEWFNVTPSESLQALLPLDSSETKNLHWKFLLQAKQTILSADWVEPISLEGVLRMGANFQLDVPSFKFADLTGNLHIEDNKQELIIRKKIDKIDVPFWVTRRHEVEGMLVKFEHLSSGSEKSKEGNEGKGKNKKITMDWQVDQFKLSSSHSRPLQLIISSAENDGNRFNLDTLHWGAQVITGTFRKSDPTTWDVQLQADALDLIPWIELANHWDSAAVTQPPAIVSNVLQKPVPDDKDQTLNAKAAKSLPSTDSQTKLDLRFQFNVKQLWVGPEVHWPFSLQGRYLRDSQSKNKDHFLALEQFKSEKLLGHAKLNLQEEHPALKMEFQDTDLPFWGVQLKKMVAALPKTSMTNKASKKSVNPQQKLVFDLNFAHSHIVSDSPAHLQLAGVFKQDATSSTLEIQQFKWDQQKGSFIWQEKDTGTYLNGHFDYLYLGAWDEFMEQMDQIEAPEVIVEKNSEKESITNKENNNDKEPPLTFSLPSQNYTINLTAKQLRLRTSVFDDMSLKITVDDKKMDLQQWEWKAKNEQVLSAKGELSKINPQLWQGDFKADISDLGDLVEMMGKRKNAERNQYPIDRGRTKIRSKLKLVPYNDVLWMPDAEVKFESKEGIIKRGKSIVFVVAALSFQSYLNAVEGKLSGFENEGLPFNVIEADIHLKGPQVEIDRFVVDNPIIRVVMSGVLDLKKEDQDLLVCLQPFETLDKVFSSIKYLNLLLTSRRGSFLEYCYQSRGAIDDPNIIPLPQSFLPGRMRDLLIFEHSQLKGPAELPKEHYNFQLGP